MVKDSKTSFFEISRGFRNSFDFHPFDELLHHEMNSGVGISFLLELRDEQDSLINPLTPKKLLV